tara:strand:- start:49 stop:726 length:678 start_codon:yes stop_codon:yes gene_type:complete
MSDLSKESQSKIATNPLRILDSDNPLDIKISKDAPKIKDLYSIESQRKFEQVKNLLDKLKVKFKIDEKLVRGLDYYCHTVFEFKSNTDESQNTLIGGGRYDGLIKLLGGPDTPGVGWASGIERLMHLSKKINFQPATVNVIILDEKYKEFAVQLIHALRENKIKTTFDYKYNLKKSLSNASANKVPYVVIIGEDEYQNNKYTFKKLSEGTQSVISLEEIINKLKK